MNKIGLRTFVLILVGMFVVVSSGTIVSAQRGNKKGHGGNNGDGSRSGAHAPGWQKKAEPAQVPRQPVMSVDRKQKIDRGWQRNEIRRQAPPFQTAKEGRERVWTQQWHIQQGKGREKVKHDRRQPRREERSWIVFPQRDFRREYKRGWIPPGQIRRQEVHRRNAIRKAWKDEQKALRRLERRDRRDRYRHEIFPRPIYREDYHGYRPYDGLGYEGYYDRMYVQPYRNYSGGYIYRSPIYVPSRYEPEWIFADDQADYLYDDGFDWKDLLLRTVIGYVLDGDQDLFGFLSDEALGGLPFGFGEGDRYAPYQPVNYQNYGTVVGPPAYLYPSEGFFGALPIGDLVGNEYAGYPGDILRNILAQGYQQGFAAGWYARESEYRDEYLRSLNDIDPAYYQPYSVTIGENRRIFSEGYALGYQDALAGRRGLATDIDGGNDLLSVILSSLVGLS